MCKYLNNRLHNLIDAVSIRRITYFDRNGCLQATVFGTTKLWKDFSNFPKATACGEKGESVYAVYCK